MPLLDRFETLIRIFEETDFELPGDPNHAIETLPPVEAMPSPWEAWTVINLVLYRERQLRAAEVLACFMGPEWGWRCGRASVDQAAYEEFFHSQSEWKLVSLGGDAFMNHIETGALIHVDVVYGPEVIKEDWFAYQMGGGEEVKVAEDRLGDLFPMGHGLNLAMEGLKSAGLIDAVDEGHFELCERLKECAESVAAFAAAWRDPDDRVRLGSLINDWPAAHEAAKSSGDAALVESTAGRARRCRDLRCGPLRDRVTESGLTPELLCCLSAAGAPELSTYLEEALGASTGLTTSALELISDDPSWCPRVHGLLLLELSRRSDHRSPRIAELGAEYLVKHGYRAGEVIRSLGSSLMMSGHAAVLTLRYRPELATPFIRSALRGCQGDREMAAAALAVIDRPWSRRELTGVLDESSEPEATLECRLALRESQSYEARLSADAWERENLGPAAVTAPGRAVTASASTPCPSSDEDEKILRRWMARLRPLLSDVQSPTPFTDMLGG